MRRITFILLFLSCYFCYGGNNVVKIWDKHQRGRNQVTLTAFLPESNKLDASVIICPGGSYFWLDKKVEGVEVAEWLSGHGIAAFLLEYRVGGKVNFLCGTRLLYGGNHFPHMLQDVQQAIHYLRENADSYMINPSHIGVMGFSAGGHLSMLSAELSDPEYLLKCGTDVKYSLKPNFVVPIYPVVTFIDRNYRHNRSKRGLLGEYCMHNRTLLTKLSLELNVPDDCCPVFIVNAKDDKVVDYHNSVLLDSALVSKGIPHKYIQYPVGGHGFGCRSIVRGEDVYDWKSDFLSWLKSIIAD